MYLLDTNVISELRKRNCNQSVKQWVMGKPPEQLYMSVLSIGEIRYGINKLADTNKKSELLLWLESSIPDWFENRLLPIDARVMSIWGALKANNRALPIIDSILCATAIAHELIIVTRNSKDFADVVNTVNPWQE
jgi:predicted nucleic acid-binding protein